MQGTELDNQINYKIMNKNIVGLYQKLVNALFISREFFFNKHGLKFTNATNLVLTRLNVKS